VAKITSIDITKRGNIASSPALLMPISRRSVLRGLSAAATTLIASPLASALAAGGSGDGYSKRFILVGLFYGVEMKYWYPSNVDAGGYINKLGHTLSEGGLIKYLNKILQVKGVHHTMIPDPDFRGGFAHSDGLTAWHTGDTYAGGKIGKSYQRCRSPSIDQIIAPHLSSGAPIESLQWQSGGGGVGVRGISSWKKSADGMIDGLPSIREPKFLYERLVNSLGGSVSDQKKSILSINRDDINLMKKRFGTSSEEGQMLNRHLDVVKRTLENYDQSTSSCDVLKQPPPADQNAKKIEQNMDLTAVALTCGLTNTTTLS
jgi:hypothetical protein